MGRANEIKAGVIGWPVSHSLSPRLHGFWLNKYGIAGSYEAIALPPEHLPNLLSFMEEKGLAGVNVTIPHKEGVLALLQEVDALARRIGAVNTIYRQNNTWCGTNTDVYGFMENLGANSDIWRDGNAIIIGAGGAARAIAVGLLDAGFEVVIANRSEEKAEALRQHLGGKRITTSPWHSIAEKLGDASLLVNTTSLGMKGQPQLEMSLARLSPEAYVTDIVYNPEPTERTRRFSNPTMTDFLARAAENGNKVIDGLGMLLYQAQPGFELWFGQKPEVTRALRSHVLDGLFHEKPA